MITLADGRTVKPISSLAGAGGGKPEVLSAGSVKRGIEATTRGTEMIPRIRITAGRHTLLLTQWHPVMLADGTAVAARGDLSMQTLLEKGARHQRSNRTPEEIRKALPPEWRQDYDNALRDQAGSGK